MSLYVFVTSPFFFLQLSIESMKPLVNDMLVPKVICILVFHFQLFTKDFVKLFFYQMNQNTDKRATSWEEN